MNTTMTWIAKGLLTIAALSAMGCGSGFKSGSVPNNGNAAASVNNAKNNVPQIDMQQIKTSVSSAQDALGAAQAALGQLFDANGNFNFGALTGGVNFGNLQTCVGSNFTAKKILFLPQDIANALNCVLNDVETVAGAAKTDIQNALTLLNGALVKVPPGSPEANEIQAMIDQVNQFETTYLTTVHSLGSQVSMATAFLATLPSLASSVCPIPFVCGIAVNLLLHPINLAINDFQIKMENL